MRNPEGVRLRLRDLNRARDAVGSQDMSTEWQDCEGCLVLAPGMVCPIRECCARQSEGATTVFSRPRRRGKANGVSLAKSPIIGEWNVLQGSPVVSAEQFSRNAFCWHGYLMLVACGRRV